MKLGPVTKLEKRDTATSKNDDEVMSANCDVIVIFLIYVQFGGIRKPDSGRIICKIYIFINLLSYKNRKQNLKILSAALIKLLWVKVPFLAKNADSLQKNAASAKLKGYWY